MPNLNKVLLMGRLTKTPELRYTPNGKAVSDLGIATTRHWKDGGDKKQFETTFTQVTVWGSQAELITKFLGKGDPILVEGRLHLERWKTKDGEDRQKLKVMGESFQFVGNKKEST